MLDSIITDALRSLWQALGSNASAASSRRTAASTASAARNKVREFASGDQYEGDWNAGVPHGNGRYTWKDGSFYDGSWQVGRQGLLCSALQGAASTSRNHYADASDAVM